MEHYVLLVSKWRIQALKHLKALVEPDAERAPRVRAGTGHAGLEGPSFISTESELYHCLRCAQGADS